MWFTSQGHCRPVNGVRCESKLRCHYQLNLWLMGFKVEYLFTITYAGFHKGDAHNNMLSLCQKTITLLQPYPEEQNFVFVHFILVSSECDIPHRRTAWDCSLKKLIVNCEKMSLFCARKFKYILLIMKTLHFPLKQFTQAKCQNFQTKFKAEKLYNNSIHNGFCSTSSV